MNAAPVSAPALTMNFIVVVDEHDHRDWVLARAERVVGKHPSRLTVLDERGDGAELLATAREQIVAGVPTIVWWGCQHLAESGVFPEFARLADCVVVDSSGQTDDERTLCELAKFSEACPDVVLHDLAFLRLANWQEMVALFFDDPDLWDDLFSIRSLRIESGSVAEALYLAGWLGSRLEWTALDARTLRARDGGSIAFTRTARGGPRRVVRVCLASENSTYLAALCNEDEMVVRLSIEGKHRRPSRLVPLHAIDNISLIERAILSPERDPLFERSLATLRGLL